MNTRTACTASATAGSVSVAIVDGQGAFPAYSAGSVLRRWPPGMLARLGFGRATELSLMAANATVSTWVVALPIGLI